uniref:protein-glutamine gamma-glutamyltransferase n=1 Tax=Mola mola TaxID=94237 RepID=A0A3Q3WSN6_MOLML
AAALHSALMFKSCNFRLHIDELNVKRLKKTLNTYLILRNVYGPIFADDWVYLPDERERQEYVMNEEGLIYYGTSVYPKPMTWVFGQFEEEMVDIVLKILDVNPKHAKDPSDDVSARCNPIYVGRVLSAMINANGDRGVLEGRWVGSYDDGVRPTHWTGSVSILQQWYRNNCRPVKYGQCWVFAGVMCTVMRFLGIPCRVVTNFQSAHDTNRSLTIDKYYDDHGERSSESKDSVWNFHVWVEGWMKRPDLQKGNAYDGWQVLDPTPQEKSEGTFCCGPAPVTAILQGEVNLKYDVPFVFAEVNADIVKWMVSAFGSKRKIHTDTSSVGQKISTKAVDNGMRDDITHSYKYREGKDCTCKGMRQLHNVRFRKGLLGSPSALAFYRKPFFKHQETKMLMGQDIRLKLKLNNKDHTSKAMSIRINAQTMLYDGRPGQNIQTESAAFYKVLQRDVNVFQLNTITKATSYNECVCVCQVLSEARLARPMTLGVKFTNPLNETLKNCCLTVMGYAASSVLFKAGLRTVVADFDCSAFTDVKGTRSVHVSP